MRTLCVFLGKPYHNTFTKKKTDGSTSDTFGTTKIRFILILVEESRLLDRSTLLSRKRKIRLYVNTLWTEPSPYTGYIRTHFFTSLFVGCYKRPLTPLSYLYLYTGPFVHVLVFSQNIRHVS